MRKRLKVLLSAIVLISILSFNEAVTSTVAMSEPIKEVDLTINHKSITVGTSAKTVEEALGSIGYQYKITDRINHELNDRVLDQMAIVVNSEKEVNLSIEDKDVIIKTNAGTVEELLKEEEIEVGEDEIVIPSLDSRIHDNETILIIHHDKEVYTESKEIEHKVKTEYSFDVPFGETIVVQKGEDGKLEEKYERTTKNGIVSDKVISERVAKHPITEEIIVGTKEVKKKKIKNKTITRENDSMFVGETEVIQEGQKGLKEFIYENDGKSKTLMYERIVKRPKDKIIEKGTKEKPSVITPSKYTLSEFKFNGVIRDEGKKYTYYSQSVLPGGGLQIPGRHINEEGYVADGDGYIAVASNRGISKGTIIDTPFGYKGKVYDVCASCTNDWFDVYVE